MTDPTDLLRKYGKKHGKKILLATAGSSMSTVLAGILLVAAVFGTVVAFSDDKQGSNGGGVIPGAISGSVGCPPAGGAGSSGAVQLVAATATINTLLNGVTVGKPATSGAATSTQSSTRTGAAPRDTSQDKPQWTGKSAPVPSAPLGAAPSSCGPSGAGWNAGNIVSDAVFYNTKAMTADQIDQFIAAQDAPCGNSNQWCLKNLELTYPPRASTDHCAAIPAGTNVSAGRAIYDASQACGVNPQIMLAKLQLESQGLDRVQPSESNYDAAWGWNCPDTGPGGSANCDPAHKGFVNQLQGMSNTWANLKVDIPAGKYKSDQPNTPSYMVGPSWILWNVAETGCGGSSVNIANVATASLYVYTPYQPNAASLAAYPGTGDQCSSYGNRNFFFMFQKYFGSTGGGQSIGAATGAVGAAAGAVGAAVIIKGAAVTIPNLPDIAPALRGKVVNAPNAQVAAGLAWAFSNAVGLPYVYGGGGLGSANPGGPDNGCARASCLGLTGYDCSGLSWSVLFHMTPSLQISQGNSGGQAQGGVHVDLSQALAGDLITYGAAAGGVHHVAVSLGYIDGQLAILEAPDTGLNVRVKFTSSSDIDSWASRYWAAAA